MYETESRTVRVVQELANYLLRAGHNEAARIVAAKVDELKAQEKEDDERHWKSRN